MPELGYEFDDGTGYRELNLYLVGLTVDGVTVWEKPKEREAMDINAIRAKALALQQEMFRQGFTSNTKDLPYEPRGQALYDALCAFTAHVPKPKERVRVHPEREEHRRKMLFLQEEGDYDIYLAPDGADTYFYPRYFPAVYEER